MSGPLAFAAYAAVRWGGTLTPSFVASDVVWMPVMLDGKFERRKTACFVTNPLFRCGEPVIARARVGGGQGPWLSTGCRRWSTQRCSSAKGSCALRAVMILGRRDRRLTIVTTRVKCGACSARVATSESVMPRTIRSGCSSSGCTSRQEILISASCVWRERRNDRGLLAGSHSRRRRA